MHNHAALNRIYRLVWSHVNSCWVAVAETAKGHGKSAVRRKLLALVALALAPVAAHAGLEGGVIVGGQGSIVNPNLVIQNSARLAINAMGFSVGAGEIFNLQQQSASDMALIRVLGQNPSDIFGTINAKGQLLLSNPNGILFGKDSQVNVGGLIATTLNIDAADFMLGNYNFFKNKKKLGAVVNQGILTAADGGYIALLSPEVRNEGVVSARLGSAALLAGDKVTLNLNEGALVSYAIDQGAVNALAENKQLIQADGGQVFMGAKAANSLTTAVINNTGIIRARTVQNQDGKIMLMGDMQVGAINVGGTLDASAPIELNPNGGSGGFIETSAAHVKVADSAKVTTLAATGSNGTHQNGTWLIDPNDFTISTTGDMSGAAVSAALAGGNFTIQTTSMGTAGGNGDIFVNEAVNWNTNNTFTLNAERNININADITATGATGKLSLLYGQASAAGGTNDNYFIDSANGVKVNLQAGDNFSTQKGSAGTVINYTVITDLGAAGSITGTDLQGMNGDLTKSYALGADIDATATSGWNGGLGWDPVGDGVNPFAGNFDGLGHAINNLTINRPIENDVGLFGTIQNSTISNISLINSNITASFAVGGFAGYANNTLINNSYVSGAITALEDGAAGGLVGRVGLINITNSYTEGSVVGSAAGGFVGEGDVIFINNSYSASNVTSFQANIPLGFTYAAGGLVGDMLSGSIVDSYATGNVTSTNGSIYGTGGLVGSIRGFGATSIISNSYATGDVNGGDNTGGLVGYLYTVGNAAIISDSYATGMVNGFNYVGGLVGYIENDGGISITINNSYATGMVSGFNYVGGLVGYAENNGGISVGINGSNATGSVTGANWVGGLLGNAIIVDIAGSYASGNVEASGDFVGGLSGSFDGGTIVGSHATGTVSGVNVVGGLVGRSASSFISDSYALGNVTATGNGVGGLVGQMTNSSFTEVSGITNSYAAGNVTGAQYVGGLVGLQDQTTISNSYAVGNVNGDIGVGGLVGRIGSNTDPNVVTDAYATGNVTGNDMVGGLVGDMAALGGMFTRTYATGLVTSSGSNVGGLIGQNINSGNAVDSFWDTQTTGQMTSAGGTGKTTAEMKTLSTYTNAGWNIDDAGSTGKTWRIYEGNTAPLLRYFLAPVTLSPTNDNKAYDGLAYIGSNGLTIPVTTSPGDVLGMTTYGGTAQGAINVGSYTLTAADNYSQQYSGYDALLQNYDISYVGGTLTITPAPLLVTANNATKTYNGQAYSGGNGVTYSGFVNGETSSVLAGSLSYGGSSQGAVNPGVYSITASGFTNGNYAISYVPSSLAITYTTPIDTSPVLSVAYHGAKDISSGICTVNGLSGAEAYVQVMNNRFALTEVALYELDANEVVADTNQLKLTSNCMCDDTNRSFKDVDVTVLDGGVRMPDNRLSSYQNQEDIEIIKTPRVIRSRSAL